MNWPAYLSEDRRLAILRFLAEQPGHTLNDAVLQTALERIGHATSRDTVRTELAWLAEQGLVTVEVILGRVHVARLEERGYEAAAGRVLIPGVKRPTPRG